MSSNGIYVYDIKHGTPKTYEEAHEILDTLSGFKESAPNPNMAAFGAKMAEFVRQAWQFYEGDDGLSMCLDIAEYTASTHKAKYSFEFPPKQYPDSFSCAIIRAACENNLVVLHGDFECVFLPDGTAFDVNNQPFNWHDMVEKHEQIWQAHIQELIAKQNQPQIPVSTAKRDRLTDKIIEERLGNEYTELLKKYTIITQDYLWIETDFCTLRFFVITEKDKFQGDYLFRSSIFFRIEEEYKEKVKEFIPSLVSIGVKNTFFSFYGLSNEANPNLDIYKLDNGTLTGHWRVHEYDEWVKLIEAAADMLMYYLPHIGTVEDFMKFVKAHDAGETHFAELTLPETNPDLREVFTSRYLNNL